MPKVTIEHTDGVAEVPLLHRLSASAYPLAVCNDGSPGFYALRRGFGKGAKRWLIYLEGGGQCATAQACESRYTTTKVYMSSEGIKEGAMLPTALEGIKSTSQEVNPDFYDATLVQLGYCSSDLWTGDRAGDAKLSIGELGRWNFRGRRILEAVLQEMMATQGLDQATEVFLLGSSAGGLGIFNNADDVRAMLAPSTRLVSMADAGFFIDYPTYDPKTGKESTDVPTKKALELLALPTIWQGRGDASCEAAASTDEEHARCRSPYELVKNGHLDTPLFIRQSEQDAVQLKGLIEPAQKDANAKAYRLRFAQEIAKQLHALDGLESVGVFASNDKAHGVINDNLEWSGVTIGTVKLPPAVGIWYRDPCGASVKHIAEP